MKPVEAFLRAALEASIYVRPRDHGLTRAELQEVASRVSLLPGEVNDALAALAKSLRYREGRLQVGPESTRNSDFIHEHAPDLRNPDAYDALRAQLTAVEREVGLRAAALDRDVLVARAEQRGFSRDDLEVAVTMMLLEGMLAEENGLIRHAPGRHTWITARDQVAQRDGHDPWTLDRSELARALPLVRDVLARRTDSRAPRADPLDAFETVLSDLGQERFRAWWIQWKTELRRADPGSQPGLAVVASAALAEAALAFVIPRAQARGLMKGVDVAKPRQWKLIDLAKGAKSGDPNVDPIFDEFTVRRALDLNDARQRIHAGFLVDTVQSGPIPDLKPEQARDARHAADAIVRRILDWLERHP